MNGIYDLKRGQPHDPSLWIVRPKWKGISLCTSSEKTQKNINYPECIECKTPEL